MEEMLRMSKQKHFKNLQVQFLPSTAPINEQESSILLTQLMMQALIIGARVDKNNGTITIKEEITNDKEKD